jgi:hypothetical protein
MKTTEKRLIRISVWLTLFACTLAMAQSTAQSPAAEASTQVVTDWRGLVEALVAHPEILTKDWDHMRRVLPVGCFRNEGSRDLSCPPMDGVERISASPGPTGLIDVVLKPPATCNEVYDVVSKRFGKGVLENGDKCYVEWNLRKWVKRSNVNLWPSRKDPSVLFLQFGVEQGP